MAGEIATAYVQIIPSMRGAKSQITQELGGTGTSVGKSIAGKIAGAISTAGLGAALWKSLNEGGALEQSRGGIKKLFGDDMLSTITENANKAYATAGISANKYMEQASSFAASLIKSTGDNTAEAARIADMAIQDMSDNANVFGTDIGRIQDAYQGFARGNYLMLDNLKLGYGGTKTEMQRLLADAEKLSGVKYDIDNLSDVFSAIHVIQEELKITGATAVEARETFTGSFNAMRAAAQNVLAYLMLGEELQPHLLALTDTAITFFAGNFLPAVGNIVSGIPQMIGFAAREAATAIKDEFGVDLMPAIDTVAAGFDTVTTAAQSFYSFITSDSDSANFLQSLVLGLVSAYVAYQTVTTAVGLASAAQALFNAVLNANPIGVTIALIAGLVAGIMYLWNTSESFRAAVMVIYDNITGGMNALYSTAESVFSGIDAAATKYFDLVGNTVDSAVNYLKGLMRFEWSLPRLKLPHFTISGNFSLNPPSVPTFGVDWYAKGAILRGAQIFGYMGGKFLGGGEAGPEAVLPLNSFYRQLEKILRDKPEGRSGGVRDVHQTIYFQGKTESPAEVARKTRIANRQLIAELQKG